MHLVLPCACADIWAVGIVLLECALGKFPYAMTGVYLDMMQAVVNGPSPSLPKSPDGSYGKYSREFANFVQCCLCKDPEQRSTAEELLLHPWFAHAARTFPRSPAQMQAWIADIKLRLDARHRA